MEIQTWANYSHTSEEPKKTDKPHRTKPNLAYTPRELISRFAKGQSLGNIKMDNLHYTQDLDLPEVRAMDLVDIENLKKVNKEFVEDQKRKLKEADDKAKARRAEHMEQVKKDREMFNRWLHGKEDKPRKEREEKSE